MLLNVRIKRYLNDLIDYTYPDVSPQEIQRYKRFMVYISLEEKRSRGAYYDESKHIIVLHNLKGGNDFLLFSSIHELAHHLDWCVNGECSGHQKPWYIEYKKLFFTALNMGLVDTAMYKEHPYGYKRERQYIEKWLTEYRYEYIDYKPNYPPVIKVYNSFSIKDELKEMHYSWNTAEMIWEKESTDLENDIQLLKSLNVTQNDQENTFIKKPYYVLQNNEFHVDPYVFIEAKGDTYQLREYLKEYGFFFREKGKKWLKKCKSSDYHSNMAMLRKDKRFNPKPKEDGDKPPSVTFDVQKRKAVQIRE